jgi:CRP-like cAMP-binding protein
MSTPSYQPAVALEFFKSGEIFGEMAAIGNTPRSATAVARTACRVIALDDRQFKRALWKKPGFALMLMDVMVPRLRDTVVRLRASDALSGEAAIARAERLRYLMGLLK